MGPGRARSRCALWGGISLGVGTVAFALFSSSSAGCSTNVVVLTHSMVTARGCAAFSVVSRLGIGLIVLGAVLLLGSFALAVRARRQGTQPAAPADVLREPAARPGPAAVPVAAVTGPPPVPGPVAGRALEGDRPPATQSAEPLHQSVAVDVPSVPGPAHQPGDPAHQPGDPAHQPGDVVTPEAAPSAGSGQVPGPTEPHSAEPEPVVRTAPLGAVVRLPPGWYGNPNSPGKPVQWWDGEKLTDRPE